MTSTTRALVGLVNDTVDDLGTLTELIHHGLLQRLDEAEAGPPAASFDRPLGGAGGPHADPTAAAALDPRTDLARLHRAELGRLISALRGRARRALDIAALYPVPTTADLDGRTALGRLNAAADPGCDSCARTTGPAGTPRWEPPTAAPVALDANVSAWLCRWCHDALRQWGRLPTLEELARHHAGQRVAWPADIERPA